MINVIFETSQTFVFLQKFKNERKKPKKKSNQITYDRWTFRQVSSESGNRNELHKVSVRQVAKTRVGMGRAADLNERACDGTVAQLSEHRFQHGRVR